MSTNTASAQWKQIKGKIKAQWGRLTDNDLTEIDGRREQLIGKLQERYGKQREEVDREVANFYDSL